MQPHQCRIVPTTGPAVLAHALVAAMPSPYPVHARIKEGDEVVVFIGYDSPLKVIIVKRGELFSSREGFFPHDRMIGLPYGGRVLGRHRDRSRSTSIPAPYLTLLRNTPELWTQALPHRTQIIYHTDISVVVAKLRLRPGCVVLEAGTGSGSLTHSLARAVAPNGTVRTFDFHQERARTARAEFTLHGVADVVVSGWRDVCAAEQEPPVESTLADLEPEATAAGPRPGYGVAAGSADATFLDVPSPWLAVGNVARALKAGGCCCSYSPCIEQSQRYCDALRRSGCFFDIVTIEALSHEHVPIFLTRPDRRRLRGTPLDSFAIPVSSASASASAGEAAVAAAPPVAGKSNAEAADDEDAGGEGQRERAYRPVATDRGHTAYLTFARRRHRAEEQGEAPAAAPAAAADTA
jgi:tRNA (adenine57-N1/adenine58-N1)-methyltransferase